MKLDEIVPWGRTLEEYREMFALSDADLDLRLLGCGDGPASANAELTARGGRMVSVDPLYQFAAGAIRDRIRATADTVLAQTEVNRDQYVWTTIPDIAGLALLRLGAMGLFLNDYAAGRADGRYIAASLPHLPFGDDSFDLALCSHLLFLYSAHLGVEAHLDAVRAMLRAAPEARIFPLLDLDNNLSVHLDPLRRALESEGHHSEIVRVDYEFQKGANQMLRLRRKEG